MAVKVTFFSSTLDKVNSPIGHIRAKLTAFSLMGLITFWPIDISVVQKLPSCRPLGLFFPLCRSLENGGPSVSVKKASPVTFFLQDLVNQPNPKNVYAHAVPPSHFIGFFFIKLQLFDRYGCLRQRSFGYPMTLHSQRRCFQYSKTIATHGPPCTLWTMEEEFTPPHGWKQIPLICSQHLLLTDNCKGQPFLSEKA